MKQYWFVVVFRNGDEYSIKASNEEQAEILAQARQIREGRDYTVIDVYKDPDDLRDTEYLEPDFIW